MCQERDLRTSAELQHAAPPRRLTAKKHSFSFPGGGVRAFYQFGVAEAMRASLGDSIAEAEFYGASCGSVTAVFMATGVCFTKATRLASQLADEKGLYDTWLGLIGTWGPVIHEWLDKLLPENAHILCTGRAHIAVEHPWRAMEVISHYDTRDDVIHALLTSVHIPFVLDWRPARAFRGVSYIDGFIKGRVPVKDSSTIVVEYPDEAKRQPMVALLHVDQALANMQRGLGHGMAQEWKRGGRPIRDRAGEVEGEDDGEVHTRVVQELGVIGFIRALCHTQPTFAICGRKRHMYAQVPLITEMLVLAIALLLRLYASLWSKQASVCAPLTSAMPIVGRAL